MMGRAALRLDFHGNASQRRKRGLAFILLALVLVVAPVVYYQHLRQSAAQLEHDTAQLVEEMSRPVAKLPQARNDDGSDKLLHMVNMPWESLLDGLETATTGKVILLSMQPNARQGEATLGGEAARYADVLEYIERLKAQPGFGQTFLINHEIAEDTPGKPVRFTIVLKWGSAS
jgi:hypothetical protein